MLGLEFLFELFILKEDLFEKIILDVEVLFESVRGDRDKD